jgi:hypothetical protein
MDPPGPQPPAQPCGFALQDEMCVALTRPLLLALERLVRDRTPHARAYSRTLGRCRRAWRVQHEVRSVVAAGCAAVAVYAARPALAALIVTHECAPHPAQRAHSHLRAFRTGPVPTWA